MRIDHAVRIGVGDDLTARGLHPDVARHAQPLVGLANEAELGEAGDFGGGIARAVIDYHDFVVGVVELAQRLETGFIVRSAL